MKYPLVQLIKVIIIIIKRQIGLGPKRGLQKYFQRIYFNCFKLFSLILYDCFKKQLYRESLKINIRYKVNFKHI